MKTSMLRGGVVGLVALGLIALVYIGPLQEEPAASPHEQACSLPAGWLTLIERGYVPGRSGEVTILPRTPAYLNHGGQGWGHSGPWPYLQDVPLVFYGPQVLERAAEVGRPVTLADVAPTYAELLGMEPQAWWDGAPLEEVVGSVKRAPRLILTIVWDGGGWNVLDHWADSWPNLARMMEDGLSYRAATVGSSPSITPAVHTTLGAGVFPNKHGVPTIRLRDETGEIVDAFEFGESSRFIDVPTFAELWDEQNDNNAEIGMLGYEPWHLGMIGQGRERPGGDADDAIWLNVETNEWASNPAHYRLPRSVTSTTGLEELVAELDAADGTVDRAWGEHAILDDPTRTEETPAFIRFHTEVMKNMIEQGGYGADDVTDLLFTNYKQIDRVGHYFNMSAGEVEESLRVSDEMLPDIVGFLEENVPDYLIVLTADHGQQPDAPDVDGVGINPELIKVDVTKRFGPVVERITATDVFLDAAVMEERGVNAEEIAAYLADYRLSDLLAHPDQDLKPPGSWAIDTPLFDLAMATEELAEIDCSASDQGSASRSRTAVRSKRPT